MYIETSPPTRTGDKAQLISPTYPPTAGRCLNFYYHMLGPGIGTLNVYKSQQGQNGPTIWSSTGNKGDQWNIAQVTLNSNLPFQVSSCFSFC
ncbi:hypothetical protein DPMN_011736 [Dreissena polymorpha]|uniref:MAM domain-containing protein n=1 Tax=Dreissena polymorpha TaxID=45954 RepID=A0A9D4S2Q7_DREPO|nr:hypothetical protein DPMN_011736 [Dreissena polymorpha]